MTATQLAGIDPARLGEWAAQVAPGARIERIDLITGGKSNLTYRLRGRAGDEAPLDWVLRRPPLGTLTPSAHDMGREYRVVHALQGSPVPVAPSIALGDDTDVLGVVFAVYGFVAGRSIQSADEARAMPVAERAEASLALATGLAALHQVDAAAVGLGAFGRPDGFTARQVTRWAGQWERVRTRELPVVAKLADELAARVPPAQRASILHGDLRLDNAILAPQSPRILAFVDWEMAALGDPLTDLATLLVYADRVIEPVLGVPHLDRAGGFPSQRELAAAYARASGLSLDDLDFYLALAYLKLAVIAEGIHHRFLAGDTVGEGFATAGAAVEPLLRRAVDHVRGL
ncbi:phosphotransferase family protein [Microbacterium hominis]|uniref:Phosphotransferase family protein n=1 Tax=Microbacterium hominis TaxID=162426 RepID=A0A7D4UHB0_9MICO|nr:phosphotransferase family protein [Microbacterium hominis]QKJ20709.1 phosphotransferase family protein [Microbacterium hominis]